MRVEVINTGTELLLGDIVNTNFRFLAKKLNAQGFDVLYQTTVGDNPVRMAEVLQLALSRADIVVTTGGLGPTRGDITAEVVAKTLNLPLKLDENSLAIIKKFFAARHLTMTDNNIKQALIPEGATVLPNLVGTAPGMAVPAGNNKVIILLPGPPREMMDMTERSMLPYLSQRYPNQGIILSRVLHLQGLGESSLATMLDDIITEQSNPTVAIYARNGELIIRITAKSLTLSEAEQINAAKEKEIRDRCEKYIFGVDDASLPQVLGEELLKRKCTIALAESCTGGLASSMITDVPGSSDYLLGSVVTYSNMAKHKVINVSQQDLDTVGAVSETVAKQMAEGVRKLFNTSIGIGITGIAGPGGATKTKSVGLVYIAVSDEKGAWCTENKFRGTRVNNKLRSAMTAFAMALNKLKEDFQEEK